MFQCPEPFTTRWEVIAALDAMEVHCEEPVERVFGDGPAKWTRNHKRQRVRAVVQDVARHVAQRPMAIPPFFG